MHLSTGAKVPFPAYCIDGWGKRLRLTEAPRFQSSLLQVRTSKWAKYSVSLSVVSMTACIFLRRPRGSTAKLSIPERISASGDKGTGRCSAFRGRTLDAAQKINLVKLDPRTNCLLPRRLRGILSFRCGDRIGIGTLVNCNRLFNPSNWVRGCA